MIWENKEIKIILQKKNINLRHSITGASIDTRTIKKGNIFFAVRGKFFNGNYFIEKAIEKGASLCFGEKIKKNRKVSDIKIIIVKKIENIINQFAIFRRNSIKGKILTVTGSVGKTSIKEFISLKLSIIGKTFVSFANFNNYYGIMLSVINCPKCIDFCVLELGMNKKGEILHLNHLLKPQIILINSISSAHGSSFLSIKNIVYAKTEVLFKIKRGSITVLNNYSKYLYLQYITAKQNLLNIFVTKERNKVNSNCSMYKINKYNKKNIFIVFFFNKYYSYITKNNLDLILVINLNFLFILMLLKNIYFFIIRCKIKILRGLQGRGNVIMFKNIGNKIINEAYNSSPKSLFYIINKNSKEKRLIMFIGDIKEFGKYETSLHKDLNIFKIGKLFPIGELIKYLAIKMEKYCKTKANIASIISLKEIINYIKGRDVFCFKSSGVMKIYKIKEKIENFLRKI